MYVMSGSGKNASLLDTHKRVANDGIEPGKGEALNRKRLRMGSEDKVCSGNSKVPFFRFIRFLSLHLLVLCFISHPLSFSSSM